MVTKNGHMNTGILGDVGKYSNIAMFQTGHLEKAVLKTLQDLVLKLGQVDFSLSLLESHGLVVVYLLPRFSHSDFKTYV